MSKTTKIIAALGVVAGLGVAALPAFTYAVTERSVSGAVKLEAEVLPSIAMTIQSNSDNANTYYAEDPDNAAAGYGVNYDATSRPNNIEYTVESNLFTNWSSAKTQILPNATDETMNSVVTVYTNAGNYALSVQDENDNNDLVATTGTIAPIDATGTLVAGTAGGQWGIKGGDKNDKYYAVPKNDSGTTALVLKANGTGSGSGETTTFTYGVATAATQAAGVYSDVIVYTATASN